MPILWRMGAASITLNGETRALARTMTVRDLLAEIGLDARKVAVERNEEIVPRSAYDATWLAAGDALEIVHFIGGG
jgi:thiamine biosynthesis protein ThiS